MGIYVKQSGKTKSGLSVVGKNSIGFSNTTLKIYRKIIEYSIGNLKSSKLTKPKLTEPKLTKPKLTKPKFTMPKLTKPNFINPKTKDLIILQNYKN
jgi:hypothetical protein